MSEPQAEVNRKGSEILYTVSYLEELRSSLEVQNTAVPLPDSGLAPATAHTRGLISFNEPAHELASSTEQTHELVSSTEPTPGQASASAPNPDPGPKHTGNVFIQRALKSPSVYYLKTALGNILPRALSELCEKRPPDPIEELARWLYQWADCELYYYEKAIFAKELQLMALQLEKENARRHKRIMALKREMYTIKYILGNEKALNALMWRNRASIEGFGGYGLLQGASLTSMPSTLEGGGPRWLDPRFSTATWRRYSTATGTYSAATGKYSTATGRRSDASGRLSSASSPFYGKKHKFSIPDGEPGGRFGDSSRRYRRGTGSPDQVDSMTESRSDMRRKKRKLGALDSESGLYNVRKGKSKKFSKSRSDVDRLGVSCDSSYGSDAKRKYGFEVTPVKCTWYLAEPRVLVCVHPVLGEIRASLSALASQTDTPEWWEAQLHHPQVMYDPELYLHPDPHVDDDEYRDRMLLWAGGEFVDFPEETQEQEEQEEHD